MALEHLSDSEYQTLKTNGIAGLNDEAYNRLKLESGYGMIHKPEPQQNMAFGQFPVHTIPQSIPLVGGTEVADVAAPFAKAGKSAADFIRKAANETQQELPGKVGSAIAGTANLGASLIPQTSGQVYGQAALPLATGALGAGAKAIAGTEAGQAALGGLAKVGAGLTKISEPAYAAGLKIAGVFKRALPVEEAGNVMNQFFDQFGLKSGAAALSEVAEKRGLAAPRLKNFARFTDQTVTKIKEAPQVEAEIAKIEQDLQQQVGQKAQEYARQLVEAENNFGRGSSEAEAIHQQLHDIKNTIMSTSAKQLKPLYQRLPNPQDALAARQYLSKVTFKQGLQTQEEQIVAPIAQESKQLVDDYLNNEIEDRLSSGNFKPFKVKGYGEITSPDQIRKVFHESKVVEAFSSPVPLNRSGNADALRLTLSLLSKNPIAAAAQSPLVHRELIQGAQALGQVGTGAKLALGGTGLSNLFKKKEETK